MHEIGRRLGSGKEAEVFEYGEKALKLYRFGPSKAAAFREAANLALLERLGLPTPQVDAVGSYDGRWGLVMDRARGPSFAERMATGARNTCIEEMVRLHRGIHQQPGNGLPTLKARLSANIRRTDLLEAPARDRLLHQLDRLPDGDRLCHGDFHPWNIHGGADDAMILDWLDACSGHPAADVCRSYVLIHPVDSALATDYVDEYARLTGMNATDILAWLPPTAAARLAEGIPDETDGLLRLAGVIPTTARAVDGRRHSKSNGARSVFHARAPRFPPGLSPLTSAPGRCCGHCRAARRATGSGRAPGTGRRPGC